MAGLVDTIRGAIAPDTIDSLASHLGETPHNTGNALNSAIPVILAAMAGRAASGNAGSVVDMIRSALSEGNPLERQSALANPPAPGVAPHDGGLSSGVLGPQFGGIASTLADRFGVKADSLKTLLGVGGLLGAGGIDRALNGNVTQQGVTDLLDRERPAIEAALPSGIGGLLGGFGRPAAAASAAATAATHAATGEAGGLGRWLPWLLLAIGVIALILALRTCGQDRPTTTATTATTTETSQAPTTNTVDLTTAAPTTPVPAATVPTGSGVVSETREGRPALIVYFDTAKSDVSKDLATAAADVKNYLQSHQGATLAVSGFNDPTGNAAANAALSKRRAQEVKKALVATGISDASVKLEKPAETTGTGGTNAESRRVEVTIRE